MSKTLQASVFDIVARGDLPALRALLQYDPDVVYARGQFGDTLLLKACGAGAYDVARELLEAGADANAASSRGRTPLIEASAAGHECVVVLLLRYGAKLTPTDKLGVDAVSAASAGGHSGCVDALVARMPLDMIRAYGGAPRFRAPSPDMYEQA